MNWKKIAIYAVALIVVLKFSAQIKGALAGIPGLGKVLA